MTYPDDLENDEFDNGQQTQQQESHNLQRLRERDKIASRLEKENAALKREIAFNASGIDLNSPIGKLFAKAYDGAPSVDAVKAAAIESGVLAPPAPVVSDEEAADLAVIAQVASSNNSTAGAASNTLTVEEVAGWSMQKSLQFQRSHPTEWEALKRGEDVLRP